MRVIAGRFGGRTLVAPRGRGTRPTADRVREALFSILQAVDGATVLELSVDEDDYGNVIGRGGRTAAALRAVIKSAAAKQNRRVFVDIVEV